MIDLTPKAMCRPAEYFPGYVEWHFAFTERGFFGFVGSMLDQVATALPPETVRIWLHQQWPAGRTREW